jgi:hypothetical protein
MKRKLLGIITTLDEKLKPEYQATDFLHNSFELVFIQVFSDKKYGAVAEITFGKTLTSMIRDTVTKKQQNEYSKKLAKAFDDIKPIDTSKWVKPDEESIRNALVTHLFELEILAEEDRLTQGKADALFSVLHSISPKNPQYLTNYHYEPYFEAIMREFKVKEASRFSEMIISGKLSRENFNAYRKEVLAKMITKIIPKTQKVFGR